MAFNDYNFATAVTALWTRLQTNFTWITSKLTSLRIDVDSKASNTAFTTHIGNTTVHITDTERDTWNNKQNALSAEDLARISAVDNKANASELLNYYTKTETNNLLTNKIRKEIVNTLPAVADAEENVIYLVPNSSSTETNNVKDEYMLINGKFELMGTTQVDLSGYYTSTQVDTIISDIAQAGLNTITLLED